jgi:hypothetical protein
MWMDLVLILLAVAPFACTTLLSRRARPFKPHHG